MTSEELPILAYLFSVFVTDYFESEEPEESEEVDEDTVDLLQYAYMSGAYDVLCAILFGVEGFDSSVVAMHTEAEEHFGIEELTDEDDEEEMQPVDIKIKEEIVH